MTSDKPKRRVTRLCNMRINEVSLVDDGANPEARVVIAKRDDGEPAGKRYRVTRLKIAEISAVDRPAQSGAVATILKAADDVPDPRARAAAVDEAVEGIARQRAAATGETIEKCYADFVLQHREIAAALDGF